MIQKIPIHWLHTQAFCEQQIYLEHVKGVEVEPTLEMDRGAEIHGLLEDAHKEKAEIRLPSVDEAIKKSQKEKIALIAREVRVEGEHLYGLIDEIHFKPNEIIIIDDKPNAYPYMSNKKQVWGYCLAFEEQFKPKIKITACLRQRDTQNIVWKKEFSVEDKNNVLESVERILGIINGKRKPQPTTKKNKCMKCRYKIKCNCW